MATANFLLATDMTLGWAWEGYTEKATSKEILIWQGYGGDAIRYKGSGFRYNYNGDLDGGTLTTIDYAINVWNASSYSMQFKITGLNLHAPTVANLVNSGDYISILEYIAIDDDTFNGSTGNDNLWAFNGNDVIRGNAGNDILYGMQGHDYLDGGSGSDSMYGGQGNDTYVVDRLNDIIFEQINEGSDLVKVAINSSGSFTLPDNIENGTLINKNNFNLLGNVLNNNLIGNTAANILRAFGGMNNLTGGAGNDTFIIDSGTDTITDLGNGRDILQVNSGILNATVTKAWVASSNSYNNAEVNLTSNGQSINLAAVNTGVNGFSLINSGKATTFIGSAFDDSIIGGTGADTLNGRAGSNILNGGFGNDTYVIDITGATSSNIMLNEVYDSQGVDRLNFTATLNEFNAIEDSFFSIRRLNDGKDLAIGVFGDNDSEPINGVVIKDQFNYVGGSFNNTINTITLKAPQTSNKSITFNIAVTGSESNLIGTKGVDYMTGFGGNQTLSGGAGNDILSASRFDTTGNTGDTLYGEAGNDDISGKEGNDILDGGIGNDIIDGGDGDDVIYGKEGNDVLTGGDGFDKFVFNTTLGSRNVDRITDFVSGTDKILLDNAVMSALGLTVELH